jgi:tRNA pseudouridine55 synthase
VVDKPEGLTSHDVVNRMRRLANTRKVGHLGTLDPMATGVLPLVLGRATRLAQFFSSGEKTYDARVQFGWATDTYDREGSPTSEPVRRGFTRAELEAVLARFRGTIPANAAAVFGQEDCGHAGLSAGAQRHIAVELQPVEVHVFALDLVGVRWRHRSHSLRCSAGTYLRGIAHDVGRELGCGAFLTALRRTASGEFTEAQARTLEALGELARAGNLPGSDSGCSRIARDSERHRRCAHRRPNPARQGFPAVAVCRTAGSKYVKAVSPEGDLIAIGEVRLPNLYHPVLVL